MRTSRDSTSKGRPPGAMLMMIASPMLRATAKASNQFQPHSLDVKNRFPSTLMRRISSRVKMQQKKYMQPWKKGAGTSVISLAQYSTSNPTTKALIITKMPTVRSKTGECKMMLARLLPVVTDSLLRSFQVLPLTPGMTSSSDRRLACHDWSSLLKGSFAPSSWCSSTPTARSSAGGGLGERSAAGLAGETGGAATTAWSCTCCCCCCWCWDSGAAASPAGGATPAFPVETF
mmetsp:Transcript_24033/g.52309  ORF Transcript_24033/g.52309 Transcript_24033/m.52309 type:complete len:232 (+) Transcript_24033:134-829(+)